MAAHSIREQILLAVLDAVRVPVESLGATLHRSPTVAVSREQSPALVLFPEAEADRLLTAAHAALLADRNLGGLALGIRELDCEWDVEDADAVAASIPARYAITYRTLDTDLSSIG